MSSEEVRTMKLEVWDEIAALERRMDDLMRAFLGPRVRLSYPTLPLFLRRPFVPATDVFARNGDLVVRLEVPGIDPATDVNVTVEGGELVIRGERKQKEEVEEERYYRMEASYGAFERHIPVPEGIDEGKVKADYADGVLEVTFLAAAKEIEAPKAKTIPVQAARKVKAA